MAEHDLEADSLATGSPDIGSPNSDWRMGYAIPHLLGAMRFAHELAEIEQRERASGLGAWWDEVLARATAAVLLIVAALESYINEAFAEAEKYIAEPQLSTWRQQQQGIDRSSMLEKYDWLLVLRGREKLNGGALPTQDIIKLIELRNRLVHFRPEWNSDAKQHLKLSDQLRGKFQARTDLFPNEALFPRAWASHSAVAWALGRAADFLSHFAGKAGMPDIIPDLRGRIEAATKAR